MGYRVEAIMSIYWKRPRQVQDPLKHVDPYNETGLHDEVKEKVDANTIVKEYEMYMEYRPQPDEDWSSDFEESFPEEFEKYLAHFEDWHASFAYQKDPLEEAYSAAHKYDSDFHRIFQQRREQYFREFSSMDNKVKTFMLLSYGFLPYSLHYMKALSEHSDVDPASCSSWAVINAILGLRHKDYFNGNTQDNSEDILVWLLEKPNVRADTCGSLAMATLVVSSHLYFGYEKKNAATTIYTILLSNGVDPSAYNNLALVLSCQRMGWGTEFLKLLLNNVSVKSTLEGQNDNTSNGHPYHLIGGAFAFLNYKALNIMFDEHRWCHKLFLSAAQTPGMFAEHLVTMVETPFVDLNQEDNFEEYFGRCLVSLIRTNLNFNELTERWGTPKNALEIASEFLMITPKSGIILDAMLKFKYGVQNSRLFKIHDSEACRRIAIRALSQLRKPDIVNSIMIGLTKRDIFRESIDLGIAGGMPTIVKKTFECNIDLKSDLISYIWTISKKRDIYLDQTIDLIELISIDPDGTDDAAQSEQIDLAKRYIQASKNNLGCKYDRQVYINCIDTLSEVDDKTDNLAKFIDYMKKEMKHVTWGSL